VNLPKVIIIGPEISNDQKDKVLQNIAEVMERIILKEYGVNTKVTLKN